MWFSSIFGAVLQELLIYVEVLRFYKTKQFAVFRNVWVISVRFAVFLCYSVKYVYVILCSFAIFVPPLRPLLKFGDRGHL